MEINELVERIAFIRTRANLSARKLSILIGKTDGYIHNLEQARSFAPTFETFCAILKACNVSFEEFFYPKIENYKRDKELLELLKTAPDEKRDIALAILKLSN